MSKIDFVPENDSSFKGSEADELAGMDVKAVMAFFMQLAEHFGIPFDVEGQAHNVGHFAGCLRAYADLGTPGEMSLALVRYYSDMLADALRRCLVVSQFNQCNSRN